MARVERALAMKRNFIVAIVRCLLDIKNSSRRDGTANAQKTRDDGDDHGRACQMNQCAHGRRETQLCHEDHAAHHCHIRTDSANVATEVCIIGASELEKTHRDMIPQAMRRPTVVDVWYCEMSRYGMVNSVE